jgi:hypothetical protein
MFRLHSGFDHRETFWVFPRALKKLATLEQLAWSGE